MNLNEAIEHIPNPEKYSHAELEQIVEESTTLARMITDIILTSD